MQNRMNYLRDIRQFLKRFKPFIFLVTALFLLLLGMSGRPFIEEIRLSLNVLLSPVISVLYQPVKWVKTGMDEVSSWINLKKENEELKQQNQILQGWMSTALRLKEDNMHLAWLLNYSPPKEAKVVSARIVADAGNTYSRTVVVLAGKKEGVQKGDAAMSGDGVLGRIIQVGDNVSRLLLVTDITSRIPVLVGGKKMTGILAGDNTSYPKLTALPEEAKIQVGDKVLTSGHVGVYPSGLAVGTVVSVEEKEIRVKLFAEIDCVEFVQLVDFGLSDVLLPEEERN
jgi:rod shape-determining protein MreC